MATDRERQIARDKKLDEAVEEIKRLSGLIENLTEVLAPNTTGGSNELKKGKSNKKSN
jgi:hypothetical protein